MLCLLILPAVFLGPGNILSEREVPSLNPIRQLFSTVRHSQLLRDKFLFTSLITRAVPDGHSCPVTVSTALSAVV